MVQAPKCKLCGVAHWSTQPHVWGKAEKPTTKLEAIKLATGDGGLEKAHLELVTKVLEHENRAAAFPPAEVVVVAASMGSIRTRKKRKMVDVVEKDQAKAGAAGGKGKKPPGQVAVVPSPKRPRKVAETGKFKRGITVIENKAPNPAAPITTRPGRGRPVAAKPWETEGISRAAWYKRGNRKGD